MLKAFNTQNDVLGGCHPGLTGIPAFRDTYYTHVHALNVTGETDTVYTVSGLDCSANLILIAWEVTGTSSAPANIDKQATSNGNIWANNAYSATPIMIACYTSRLEVSAGRNIQTYT